jgi:2-amino-4-hydroxy-6-hydroxymethyldihydropteridine diphosphokinase
MERRWMIGLGANLGDARGALERTLSRLRQHPDLQVIAVSSLWRSAPVDASGPDFLNAVLAIDTALAPQAMLMLAQSLESQEGRARPHRNAPRTLDVDLLLAGSLVLDTPLLTLPHPRMHQRAFVLSPLLEVDPLAQIPRLGAAADRAKACAGQRIERLGPLTDAKGDAPPAGQTAFAP